MWSREGDVTVLTNKNRYPLFAAPMSCIIDEENYEEFEVNGINTIIPRSVKWETRLDFLMNGHWVALGFKEAKWLTTNIIPSEKIRVCIDQIVKALALGSDYVMLGSILARTDEACGQVLPSTDFSRYREYYGMSTVKAQNEINQASLYKEDLFLPKHPEGICKSVEIEYSIEDLVCDFEHALRSCMSYVGAHNLDEFKGHVKWDTMTDSSFKSYIK